MIKKPIKTKSETIIDKYKYILHLFDIVSYWSFIFFFRLNHTIPIYPRQSTMVFRDIFWVIYTIALLFKEIIHDFTYKRITALAVQTVIHFVAVLFTFSVSFFSTILYGAEVVLSLIVLTIMAFQWYLFIPKNYPTLYILYFMYFPVFSYLEPGKYKQNIRIMGVVIFILLVVIVFFWYNIEVVDNCHRLLTATDPLSSGEYNNNYSGGNNSGNNDNSGGNNPGNNGNSGGNNDNTNDKNAFNPGKKRKYSEFLYDGEEETEKFETESDLDWNEDDQGYDTSDESKEEKVEEDESRFMRDYDVVLTKRGSS